MFKWKDTSITNICGKDCGYAYIADNRGRETRVKVVWIAVRKPSMLIAAGSVILGHIDHTQNGRKIHLYAEVSRNVRNLIRHGCDQSPIHLVENKVVYIVADSESAAAEYARSAEGMKRSANVHLFADDLDPDHWIELERQVARA